MYSTSTPALHYKDSEMAENDSGSKVSLKILVDIKAKKVVFAEAGKGFVDFIFQMLSLPLATVANLLNDKAMVVTSLGALYSSFQSLGAQHFELGLNKDSLLIPSATISLPLFSLHGSPDPTLHGSPDPTTVYRCSTHYYISDNRETHCPTCRKPMTAESSFKFVSNTSASGYVNGVTNYMVMDNLEVKPMSLAHIKSLVTDFDTLEEREVEVGLQEGLAILKASLETNAVLTAAFLGKKI